MTIRTSQARSATRRDEPMPIFHLLREDPEDSGQYSSVEEEYSCSADEAVRIAVTRGAAGGRYAIWPYEALSVDTSKPLPLPDRATAAPENPSVTDKA